MTKEKKAGQKVTPVVWEWFEEVPAGWPHPPKHEHRTKGGKGEVGRAIDRERKRKP